MTDAAAKLKNDQTEKTDWVHRSHIRKIVPRPAHLCDDSSDDDDDDTEITEKPRVDTEVPPKNGQNEDKASSGGVKHRQADIKIEERVDTKKVSSEADLKKLFDKITKKKSKRVDTKTQPKAEADVKSENPAVVERDEPSSRAGWRRKKRQNSSSPEETADLRRTKRVRNKPDRLEIDHSLYKSYNA